MYLLRWRFDYLDRPSKYGQWSRSATLQSDMACFQNNTGLIRASIEGKEVTTREIKTLAECPGQDYVNFQWMAVMRARTNGSVVHQHMGLKIVTRENWVEVNTRGKVTIIPRTEDDKNFHYATFGR